MSEEKTVLYSYHTTAPPLEREACQHPGTWMRTLHGNVAEPADVTGAL